MPQYIIMQIYEAFLILETDRAESKLDFLKASYM